MSNPIRKCCYCPRKLDRALNRDDFVRLKPCNCYACPKCIFFNCCNRKGRDSVCPKHESIIEAVEFFESSRDDYLRTNPCELDKFELDLAKEPGRFFNEIFVDKREEMRDKLILSLSYVHKPLKDTPIEELKANSLTAIIDSKEGFESEKDEKNLRLIFSLLHGPIARQHQEEMKINKSANQTRLSPGDFLEYCETKDESLLLKLLYALTTGKAYFVPPRFNAVKKTDQPYDVNKQQSNFYAICVAKHMIERTMTTFPGPFQHMIGDMMSMLNVPNSLQNFFAKIRLSCSPRTSLRNLNIRSVMHLLTKIEYNILDLILIAFDNFGFKGKDGKFCQHTAIQFTVITEKELRTLGFYNNNKISRLRKTMNELMVKYKNDKIEVANSIIAPTTKDYQILSKRIMNTMATAATLDLPTANECEELIESGERWMKKVPSNLGVEIEEGESAGVVGELRKYSSKISPNWIQNKTKMNNPPQSFYDKNKIVLDEVLHGDPNSTAVVQMLLDYLHDLVDIEGSGVDFDPTTSGNEEPLTSHILPAAADGSPSIRWLQIQARDIENNGFHQRKYKAQKVFFGGFHFLMELMSMRGRISRDFTAFFARLWREEDPRLNWIYLIRDPKDGLNEWRQYLLAHYREASEKSGSTNPAVIHDYMIKRSIEKPLCMAILFDLRLLEIIFMTRDAEKSGRLGSVSMFLTCLRFSLTLFAITHATNYCHLVTEFLEWYDLGSETDHILFERYFYTRLSPNGKPIWIDKGVEWTVRHVRRFTGHRVRPNHDKKVEQTIAEIPFHQRTLKELRGLHGNGEAVGSYTTSSWNEQTFELGRPFFFTRVAVRATNLWGEGDFEDELACEKANSMVLTESKGKKEFIMSSSLLDAPRIGLDRIRDYYIEFHINQRFPTTRRGLKDSLKTLPTTHLRRLQDINITRKIRCSTNPDDFKKLQNYYDRKDIVQELTHLRNFFFADMETYNENQPRPLLVDALCEWRKIFFETYPMMYQNAWDSVEEMAESEAQTTTESRSEQIQSTLYSLDQEIVELYRNM